MPRKTQVHWINKPRDLNKCHSRRCDQPAIKDRLCAKHWSLWHLAGFEPPTPVSYSGRVQEPAKPLLQTELEKEREVLADVINAVASLALDDASTPEQLEAVLVDLQKERAEIHSKKRQSMMPYVKAYNRTKRWFEPVEQKLDEAVELAQQRLSTIRSTAGRPAVRKKGKKAG